MKQEKLNVLVIDDDPTVRLFIKKTLSPRFNIKEASGIGEALSILKKNLISIAFVDIILEDGKDGLTLIKKIKNINEDTDVIVISHLNMVDTVISAIRKGACDYVQKPINTAALNLAVERVMERRNLRESNIQLRQRLVDIEPKRNVIGNSPAFKAVKEKVARLKGQNVNVFIIGETGTGKEVIARLIHDQENDPSRPFISVNCAAIPENLLESILFGHEKGAFTGATERRIGKFELANGGDIFLDEINTLPPSLQAKLLRVIEEKEIERVGGSTPIKANFRVISASNENIVNLVEKGLFRRDLFYRLNTVRLHLPTLNERREDIIPLAEYFLDLCKRTAEPKKLSPEVKEILLKHDWRGNVRELKNTIENMVIFSKGDVITEKDVPFWVNGSASRHEKNSINDLNNNTADNVKGNVDSILMQDDGPGMTVSPPFIPNVSFNGKYDDVMKNIEKRLILECLERNRWNKTKTCKELGINRTRLYRKMAELKII